MAYSGEQPLQGGQHALIAAVALATGLILPVELIQGFSHGHNLTTGWNAFSPLGLVDVALTFFTTYKSQGVVVPDRSRIARHYPLNQLFHAARSGKD
jgi:hypothetical protein